MPRHNRTPQHQRFQIRSAHAPEKKRFPTKQAAEAAIRERQKYDLDLKLSCYQSPADGGWYLTSHTFSVD